MGVLISRVQRELREDDKVDEIGQIADTYHAWRNRNRSSELSRRSCGWLTSLC
jgi:hypothetical protein